MNITLLKDKSLDNLDNLPDYKNLEAGMASFMEIMITLAKLKLRTGFYTV